MKRIKNAVWSGLWCIAWINRVGNCEGIPGTVRYTRKEAIEAAEWIFDFSGKPDGLDYKSRYRKGEIKPIRLYVRDNTGGE